MINQSLEAEPMELAVAVYELGARNRAFHEFDGLRVISCHQEGIRLIWAMSAKSGGRKKPRGVCLKPHQARALGQLLLDAVDDVAPVARAQR
jgi:hypothetical protein